MTRTLFAGVALLALSMTASAQTVGFSQIGSESGWRAAETTLTRQQAEERGYTLQFSDAQQRQENQIAAIRSFIAEGVDAIMLAPVIETGWDQVLREAQAAEIPVVIIDRNVTADESLYLTRVSSNFVHEGRLAAAWLVQATAGQCNIVELEGTVGSSAARDRLRRSICRLWSPLPLRRRGCSRRWACPRAGGWAFGWSA